MGEGRGVYRVSVGRLEGKRPLGWPRRTWEDNIKIHLREIKIDGANWIRLSQNRVRWWASVSTITKLRVPLFDKPSGYQLFKEYPAPWSKVYALSP